MDVVVVCWRCGKHYLTRSDQLRIMLKLLLRKMMWSRIVCFDLDILQVNIVGMSML